FDFSRGRLVFQSDSKLWLYEVPGGRETFRYFGKASRTQQPMRSGNLRYVGLIDGGVVTLMDTETGRELATLAHPVPVIEGAPASDGQTMMTFAEDGIARFWDIRSGRELWKHGPLPLKVRDSDDDLVTNFNRIAYSKDGKSVLLDADQGGGTFELSSGRALTM